MPIELKDKWIELGLGAATAPTLQDEMQHLNRGGTINAEIVWGAAGAGASVLVHDKLIRRASRWHGQRGDVAARTGRPAARGCLSEGAPARASRRGSPGTLAAKTVGAYNTRLAADKRVARS